jgi:hypothetical protein
LIHWALRGLRNLLNQAQGWPNCSRTGLQQQEFVTMKKAPPEKVSQQVVSFTSAAVLRANVSMHMPETLEEDVPAAMTV